MEVSPFLFSHTPIMAPCFSCRPRSPSLLSWLWLSTRQSVASCCIAPQAICTQLTLGLHMELTSGAWVSVPNPCLSVSDCGVQGWWSWFFVQFSFCFSLISPAAALFSEALSFCLHLSWPPHQLGPPRVQIPFLFHSSWSGLLVSSWYPFFSSSLSLSFSFVLHSHVEVFFPFLEV